MAKKQVKPVVVVKTPSQRLEAIGIASICSHVANGESLRSWCIENDFVQRTVLNWIEADPDRASHYAQAKEDRADLYFDLLDDVSEEAAAATNAIKVAGLRLKADNMKWKLARMNAKKYGDKVQNEVTGANGGPIDVSLKVNFV